MTIKTATGSVTVELNQIETIGHHQGYVYVTLKNGIFLSGREVC